MRSRADRDDRRRRHRWWWSAGPPLPYLLDSRTDVVAGYSFRALSSTYSGPVIRARRSSDNAELDFPALYGFLDFSTITAWAGAGNDAFATTFYDQSGLGRHLTQSTAANQPKIIQASNSHLALLFDGTNDKMQTAQFGASIAQPISANIVYRRLAAASGAISIVLDLRGAIELGMSLYQRDTAPLAENTIYAGTLLAGPDNATSMPIGTRGAVGIVFNGASSRIEVNAATIASKTGNAGTNGMASPNDGISLGAAGSGNFPVNGEAQELVYFSTAHSQAQLQADNATMRAAWGF